jgi:serine/threonine protein kinase
MSALVGARLGPYEIIDTLGAGGMGEVYRARDTRLGREVAIKVLPAELSRDPAALARFELEGRAIAALNHPNILALHDVGTDNGIAHAVMELLEGETLRKRLDRGLPGSRKALEWAVQLASGLAAAHDRGVVHRDLKPANIFITDDGRIKILDFGIAQYDPRHEDAGEMQTHAQTEPGVFVGTPAYMSPEQVIGEPATAASDMFAFGVVVYEMLTGSHPFHRDTAVETMTAILREEPPAIADSRLVQGVSSAALRVIERCLEKRPANRPASARDMAFYLDATATGISTLPQILAPETPAAGRRLRQLLAAVSIGLLLPLVAAIWLFVRTTANQTVTAGLERDLARASSLVTHVHDERIQRLQLTARLLASFPELKALFASTDSATIRDFLLTYQQRNPGTPLLVALGPTGTILGRTDRAEPLATDEDSWLTSIITSSNPPAVVSLAGRPHHTAAAAAEAGGNTFGYVIAAAPLDHEFAQALGEATGDDVVVLSASGLLASTLPGGQAPWSSLAEWRQQGGRADRSSVALIGTRRFAAREVPLVQEPPVSAIVAQSRDDALLPFQRIQTALLVLGLCAASAAAFASWWLSKGFNRFKRVQGVQGGSSS